MHVPVAALTLVAFLVWGLLLLVVLTAIGAWHRGHGAIVCLVSGVVFPVTWAVWYAIDDLAPARRRDRRA